MVHVRKLLIISEFFDYFRKSVFNYPCKNLHLEIAKQKRPLDLRSISLSGQVLLKVATGY